MILLTRLIFQMTLFASLLGQISSIYCFVGYGQAVKKDTRGVQLLSKSLWVRNCRDSGFCFRAFPVQLESAEALRNLVGGDWNDEFWGSGGFIQGCSGDFGLKEAKKGDVVTLRRASGHNESGVHVLDAFEGSNTPYEFRVDRVCNSNLCSSAWRLGSKSLPLALILSSVVSLSLTLGGT